MIPLYKEYLETCYKQIKKFDMEKNVNIKLLDISINEIAEHKNINKLLINHNAIISYSLEESFHYALAEGLASGLQGFCNGWRKLNPYQFWDEWCYKDEESFVRSLLNWGKLDKNERQKIGNYNRKYINEHFSSKNITKQYKNLFAKGKI